MHTIKSQHNHIGQPFSCLECRKSLPALPGPTLEVTSADGTVEGYLHAFGGCRTNWEAQHPGFNYGPPK